MSKLFEYADYDIQMSLDSKNEAKIQLVGVRTNGGKDILKEFDEMPFGNMNASNIRAFAAPQEKKPKPEKKKDIHTGVKIGGAFLLGLVIGGLVVFIVMRTKEKKMLAAPPTPMPDQEYIPAPEPIQIRPENEMSNWIKDYDNDIFTRGD